MLPSRAHRSAIRCTVEQEITREGERLRLVRGLRLPDRKEAAIFPGELPADAMATLATAAAVLPGAAPADWPDATYAAMKFAPPHSGGEKGDGPPHIRLDTALEFLIGDKLE